MTGKSVPPHTFLVNHSINYSVNGIDRRRGNAAEAQGLARAESGLWLGPRGAGA